MADDVTFVRTELTRALPRYMRIRDCVEQKVKERGDLYLPRPNPEDKSASNTLRYDAYIERAIFYGVTGRTLGGMVGQVYSQAPDIQVPPMLAPVVKDATGTGLSLVQLSKDAMREIVALGRGGILVDYPQVEGVTTRAQQLKGEVRPTFTVYAAENIINWRVTRRGGRLVKSLVVLEEFIDVEGRFATEKLRQFRVLRLDDFGFYTQEVWQEQVSVASGPMPMNPFSPANTTRKSWTIISNYMPRDAKGNPFTELPFEFVGAVNNDSTIDEAPLFDLAEVNIGHYRNSADYEEACFIVGQPTPWFSGLTQEWVEEVLGGEVLLGARAAVPLPENAQAGLLQVSPNSLPLEAMKQKEAQMVALGARLVENRAVRRTLGEVEASSASETSILASCADNVSTAFKQALVWAARFLGADESTISFKLNTDFAMLGISSQDRAAWVADVQAGIVSTTEARTAYRRAGIATQDDTEALAEIEAQQKKAADAALKLSQSTKPDPTKQPPSGK